MPTPWGGVFHDYGVLDGIRVPLHAGLGWELPEGRFTYWCGTITSLELSPESAEGYAAESS